MNCDRNTLIFALSMTHYYLALSIGLIVTAIATNSSFWGIAASIPIMSAAAVSISLVSSHVLQIISGLKEYYQCVVSKLPYDPPVCRDIYNRLNQLVIAFSISLGVSGLAAVAAIPFGSIPWVGAVVMSTVMTSLVVQVGVLTSIDVLVQQLKECLDISIREEIESKKTPLLVSPVVVSCPLSKATCGDSDLIRVFPSRSNRYATSKSFAIVFGAPSSAKVKATLSDSVSPATSINLSEIFSPNSHAVYDPSKWVIRVDWTKVSAAGIRVEPANRDWEIEIKIELQDGRKNVRKYDIRVSD